MSFELLAPTNYIYQATLLKTIPCNTILHVSMKLFVTADVNNSVCSYYISQWWVMVEYAVLVDSKFSVSCWYINLFILHFKHLNAHMHIQIKKLFWYDYTLTLFKHMFVPYATFSSVFMVECLFANCKIKQKNEQNT